MMLFVIVVHKAGGERFVVDSSLAPVRMAGNAFLTIQAGRTEKVWKLLSCRL